MGRTILVASIKMMGVNKDSVEAAAWYRKAANRAMPPRNAI